MSTLNTETTFMDIISAFFAPFAIDVTKDISTYPLTIEQWATILPFGSFGCTIVDQDIKYIIHFDPRTKLFSREIIV